MSIVEVENLDPKQNIIIKGARMHNLKGVDIAIPRNKLVVITGLSGSGKSSLAFDTLYAEGQRRYVESLSSYSRQFLGRLDKPDVESISGISPAIAIEQRVTSRSSRSTVGTSTEIYDYLKLLYARAGVTYSPISGKEVKRHTAADVVNFVNTIDEGSKLLVLAPVELPEGRTIQQHLDILLQQGFARITVNGEVKRLDKEVISSIKKKDLIELVIDRLVVKRSDEDNTRVADSAETAFFEGKGECKIEVIDTKESFNFSNRFELDGMTFAEPSPHFFTFNNPIGACRRCEGFGQVIGIDENLVMPDRSLSVFEDAIVCWKGEKMSQWKDQLVLSAGKFDFPIHKPVHELTKEQLDLLWNGNEHFEGLNTFFSYLEEKSYKIQYRVMLSRYRGRTKCPDCNGTRLRKDASYVKVAEKSIQELVLMPIGELIEFFDGIELSEFQSKIANRILKEIRNRLGYLGDVGLSYLTLNRLSSTLSGGESQRINLSTSLGSSLVGSLYILDEPSIGLHSRDTQRLIGVLENLRNLGNTVLVVEHDEEIMKSADLIIDMGPEAGTFGGEVVAVGDIKEISKTESLTAGYLSGRLEVPVPKNKRKWKDKIIINGARENNLKNFNIEFPLHVLCTVTGVSGSGKSTLVTDILYPAIKRHLGEFGDKQGDFDGMDGDFNTIRQVEFVDQNPIGKSSRSNPITYIKAFDDIRTLFANESMSKARGYKPSHFSFNVKGGRCEKCEGEGSVTIEMQFMADIKLQCDDCKGKRFKDEVLEVKVQGKNISDILALTVDDAIAFFSSAPDLKKTKKIIEKIQPLQDVGLGYIGLGQSSNTLSGGEAQRTKLASFLSKGDRQDHTLFIFDEPTTGLHFHDVNKLLIAFQALIEQGHSLIVIEHNMDIIKSSDWMIDLGPEGGIKGGTIVYEGVPEGLTNINSNHTAKYLVEKFNM